MSRWLAFAVAWGASSLACSLFVSTTGFSTPSDPSSSPDGGDGAAGSNEASNSQDANGADAPPPVTGKSLYARTVLEDKPTAYWRMGAVVDGVIADETGSGNSLAPQGSVGFNVAGGIANDTDGAVSLDGSSSLIAMNPRALDFLGTPMTVECWVKYDGGGADYQHLIGSSVGAGDSRRGYLLYLVPADSRGAFEWGGSGSLHGTGSKTPPANVFIHVVGVFESDTLRFYVDGSVRSESSSAGTLLARNSTFIVGADNNGDSSHLKGVVDEVAVYNYALPTAAITRHHDVGIGK